MGNFLFNIMVICEGNREQSLNNLTEKLRVCLCKLGLQSEYEFGNTGRDWVVLRFVGSEQEGEFFPQAYKDLHDYLIGRGYESFPLPQGGERFVRKQTEWNKEWNKEWNI